MFSSQAGARLRCVHLFPPARLTSCLSETPSSRPRTSSPAPNSSSAQSWGETHAGSSASLCSPVRSLFTFTERLIFFCFLSGVMVSGRSLRGLSATDPRPLSSSTCSSGSQRSCPMSPTIWLSASTGVEVPTVRLYRLGVHLKLCRASGTLFTI